MNFDGLQEIALRASGLILVIVAALIFFKSKSGDVRGSVNTLLVVVVGAVIMAIGTGMMFPSIGQSFASVIFGS